MELSQEDRPRVYHVRIEETTLVLELSADYGERGRGEAANVPDDEDSSHDDSLLVLNVQNFTGKIILRHPTKQQNEELQNEPTRSYVTTRDKTKSRAAASSIVKEKCSNSDAEFVSAVEDEEENSPEENNKRSLQLLPEHLADSSSSLNAKHNSTRNLSSLVRASSMTSESAASTQITLSPVTRWDVFFAVERMRSKIPVAIKKAREISRKTFASQLQHQDLDSPSSVQSTSYLLPRNPLRRIMSPSTSSILADKTPPPPPPQQQKNGNTATPATSSAAASLTPLYPDRYQNEPPTLLHMLCAESTVRLEDLKEALQNEPHAPHTVDARGRTPLHIIGDNDSLFGDPAGKFIAASFIGRLITVYPKAITMLDESDRMPFVPLIEDWCIWVYEKHEELAERRSGRTGDGLQQQLHQSQVVSSGLRGANQFLERVTEGLTHGVDAVRALHPYRTDLEHQRQQREKSLFKPEMSKSYLYYPRIIMWEEVEFAFEMLSMIMDELGGKNGGLFPSPGESDDRVSRKDKKTRSDLTKHIVAVIPTILKTVLLIDDEGGKTRERLFRSSLFRRLLLVPQSVGPWLTQCLHQKNVPSKRAVDYLVFVSQSTAEDYVGGFRTVLKDDVMEFEELKFQVFEQMEKLESTIASLVVLDSKDTERAAACSAVWHLMGRTLSKPFVVGLLLIDFVLHIVLMLSVREGVGLYSDNAFGGSLGSVPSSVAIMICLHYIIRKGVEAISLLTLSWNVFRSHFANMWTITDVITIVLTLIAITWNESNPGEYRNGYNALVVGLLWLRVIGFLKVVNKHMSTFIMSISQILADLKYFAVVLVVVIFQMGDMMSIAVGTKDNGEWCIVNEENLDSPAQDFCNDNDRTGAYLRVYALLLGDFELDSYRQTTGLTVLFVIFTVVGVVILLNILIAVISDSYERANLRSARLFGVARVTFVAQNEALETFLRPGTNRSDGLNEVDSLQKASVCASVTFRWLVLLTLLVTAMNAEIFLVTRAYYSARYSRSWLYVLFSILLALTLTVALWIVVIYALENFYAPESLQRFYNVCNKCSQWVVDLVAKKLFGVRQTTAIISSGSLGNGEELEEEWTGRLNHMEQMIEKAMLRSQESVRNEIRALEKRLAEQQTHMHTRSD